MELTPDILRTFVTAAQTLNFTQAAKQVNRTQSAVSLQIRKLEKDLGKLLFRRKSRGVELTGDGKALLKNARRLLRLHDEVGECKAYFMLLESFPLTGYTLSKNSGVPRCRIYDVLESLLNKQMIFVQEEEKNKLYYPMEPDILINKFRTHYENLFSKIFQFAGSIYKGKKQNEKVVVIKGLQNIMNFVNILIKGAEKRIAMSIWEEELDDITSELNKAIKRDVALKGIYFGGETSYESLVPHRRSKRHLLAKKERYIYRLSSMELTRYPELFQGGKTVR